MIRPATWSYRLHIDHGRAHDLHAYIYIWYVRPGTYTGSEMIKIKWKRMWNWNFTCLHVNQNRFHIVFHIISLSLVLQCMMWIFLFHIVFSQVSHSFSHHIIKPSLYNAWCEFPISHSFFTSSMMWKGPSHFTWFSHGDFTLFFTCPCEKASEIFTCLSHDLHMLFTWFTPEAIVGFILVLAFSPGLCNQYFFFFWRFCKPYIDLSSLFLCRKETFLWYNVFVMWNFVLGTRKVFLAMVSNGYKQAVCRINASLQLL